MSVLLPNLNRDFSTWHSSDSADCFEVFLQSLIVHTSYGFPQNLFIDADFNFNARVYADTNMAYRVVFSGVEFEAMLDPTAFHDSSLLSCRSENRRMEILISQGYWVHISRADLPSRKHILYADGKVPISDCYTSCRN